MSFAIATMKVTNDKNPKFTLSANHGVTCVLNDYCISDFICQVLVYRGILSPILMKMGPSGPSLMCFKHKAHITLGVKANVQLKSSIPIGAKVEISPKGFTLGGKAEIQKIIFNLPQVTNEC
jgi:hypothetical protein